MARRAPVLLVLLVLLAAVSAAAASGAEPRVVEAPVRRYLPTWASLDARPLPAWYDAAKVGVFVHWGVFSVPSFGSEWFWADWRATNSNKYVDFMARNYPPGFTYQDFARDFTAELFDARRWAELFARAGARYVVLTSKHHEGFTLWPSARSFGWNARDVGPKRDLVGELAAAVRARGNLHFGLYHSLYEWFNPLYLADKAANFSTRDYSERKAGAELRDLVQRYRPDVLWSDGDWEAPDAYWRSRDLLAWLYNDSPVRDSVVANDRWGSGVPCHHGDFYTCSDRFDPGVLQPHKWENAMTLDRLSWGFRREAAAEDYLTPEELVATLARTVSCRGNLLVNVGPARDGTIAPIMQERLLQLGSWLAINGEAVYDSQPWQHQSEPDNSTWYTAGDRGAVYAIALTWPAGGLLRLTRIADLCRRPDTALALLDALHAPTPLTWQLDGADAVAVHLPDLATIRSRWAWVVRVLPAQPALP